MKKTIVVPFASSLEAEAITIRARDSAAAKRRLDEGVREVMQRAPIKLPNVTEWQIAPEGLAVSWDEPEAPSEMPAEPLGDAPATE